MNNLQESNFLEMFAKANPQQFRMFRENFTPIIPTRYLLNVEATQFTLGKTKKTLERVAQQATKLHLLHKDGNQSATADHVISILITSCSLAETDQLFVRCKGRFGNKLNICTISSKEKNSRNGSGKSIDHFITTLSTATRKNCPDILLMCCHSQRITYDLVKLMEAQHNLMLNEGARAFRFKFNLFIDEADKNIKMVASALNNIIKQKLHERTIKDVNFITATPSKNFWKTLSRIGINDLDNFDFGLSISKEERENAEKKYRSILNQPFIDFTTPAVYDTLDYIKAVINESGLIDKKKRNILFVPAKNSLKDHDRIANYFHTEGWWVFMHNGPFKGFIEPYRGRRISVEEIRKHFGLNELSELRDVFREWNTRHPNESLAITGHSTIKRGLTFNTDKFNFTHMIFSAEHTKNLADFVQLLGRCCGKKEYCSEIQIIGYKKPMEEAKQFVRNILDLKLEDLEKYNKDDFKINKANEGVIIEKFDNQIDAIQKLLDVFNERKRTIRPKFRCDPRYLNENGFYINNLRYGNCPMTYQYIYNNRGWGVGIGSPYRTHICYTNIEDKNSICWTICYAK
tara:strand:+ start:53 stop:1774 length:1722 start_codon:yes stop_codon:yes gene_type:complete